MGYARRQLVTAALAANGWPRGGEFDGVPLEEAPVLAS